MPTYVFRTTDQTSQTPVDIRQSFANNEAAKQEARDALAEMAQDGLPVNDLKRLAITVLDEFGNCVVEYRLVLEETTDVAEDDRLTVMTINPEIFPR
jgi:hypothetical protein